MCEINRIVQVRAKQKGTQAKGKTPQLPCMGLKDGPFDSSSDDGNYRRQREWQKGGSQSKTAGYKQGRVTDRADTNVEKWVEGNKKKTSFCTLEKLGVFQTNRQADTTEQ